MNDIRATEQLLEFIGEQAAAIDAWLDSGATDEGATQASNAAMSIRLALAELRGRGDTLVSADDLRLVLGAADLALQGEDGQSQVDAARERLDQALTGR
jgi:hypothetical protein